MTENASVPGGLIIHERDERYFMTRLVQALLKPWKPRMVKHSKPPTQPVRLSPPKKTLKSCNVQERQIEGVFVYDVTRKRANREVNITKEHPDHSDRPPKRILYFCGGGWQMPPSASHWTFCTKVATRLENTILTIVSYPLAPQSPAPIAFPQIEKVYKILLRQATGAGETVVVAGDSSGGNIALCLVTWTLLNQKNDVIKAPVAIFAISPTTDLRHAMAEIKDVENLDPIMSLSFINLTARTWCPVPDRPGTGDITVTEPDGHLYHLNWDLEDPRVSPIQADLRVLTRYGVKVHGVIGTYDVLGPEAAAFVDKLREHGIEGEWLRWKGQMHCFPIASRYRLKESMQAVDWIIESLEKF
ncbi:Alpha/Beta hydrolase protein [Mariannaea sp. PMI_226]|nr:Alpha/Beta hydrolase protein [Mariannaea sp. PMI_226]